MIRTIITVERKFDDPVFGEEYRDVDVELQGQTEDFTSYNPDECGERLVDWCVIHPTGIELTAKEQEWAVEALEASI